MSSLEAVVFFGSKTLNCSRNSCRDKTTKIIQIRNEWTVQEKTYGVKMKCWNLLLRQLLFNIKILNIHRLVWHYIVVWLLHGPSKKRSIFTVPGMCTWLRSLTSWCEQFPAFLCIAAAEPPRPHPDTSPSAHTQGQETHSVIHLPLRYPYLPITKDILYHWLGLNILWQLSYFLLILKSYLPV